MCPLGAWRDTCELYWKAGWSRDNTGSCKNKRNTWLGPSCTHLPHHASAPHRLQGPRQGEDPPVALPQLHSGLAKILQPNAVPPPVHVVLLILPVTRTGLVSHDSCTTQYLTPEPVCSPYRRESLWPGCSLSSLCVRLTIPAKGDSSPARLSVCPGRRQNRYSLMFKFVFGILILNTAAAWAR